MKDKQTSKSKWLSHTGWSLSCQRVRLLWGDAGGEGEGGDWEERRWGSRCRFSTSGNWEWETSCSRQREVRAGEEGGLVLSCNLFVLASVCCNIVICLRTLFCANIYKRWCAHCIYCISFSPPFSDDGWGRASTLLRDIAVDAESGPDGDAGWITNRIALRICASYRLILNVVMVYYSWLPAKSDAHISFKGFWPFSGKLGEVAV